MDGKAYLETQNAILEMGVKLQSLNLTEFIRVIGRAELMAPAMDPVLFRKASNNLHAIKRLAEALLPAKECFSLVHSAVLETGLAGYMEKNPT